MNKLGKCSYWLITHLKIKTNFNLRDERKEPKKENEKREKKKGKNKI